MCDMGHPRHPASRISEPRRTRRRQGTRSTRPKACLLSMYACAPAASESGKARSMTTLSSPLAMASRCPAIMAYTRVQQELGAQEVARQRLVVGAHARDVQVFGGRPSCIADGHAPAAVGQHVDAPLQGHATHRVHDHVHAAAVGQPPCLSDEVVGGVVDALVEAELAQALEAVVARRSGEDSGAGPLRHLYGSDPHPARAGVDQRRLPRLQAAEFEEAVVGRPEGHRDAGRLVGGDAVGDLPGETLRHRPALGVRAVEADRDGAVSDLEAAYVGTHLGHGARALVAHHVGHPGQVATQPAERVASLDADRLDLHQDVAGAGHGVGHVLVAEDVGVPVS